MQLSYVTRNLFAEICGLGVACAHAFTDFAEKKITSSRKIFWRQNTMTSTRSGRTVKAPKPFSFDDFPDDEEVLREEKLWEQGKIQDEDNDYFDDELDEEEVPDEDDLAAIVPDDESISVESDSEEDEASATCTESSDEEDEESFDSEMLESDADDDPVDEESIDDEPEE